MRSEKIATAMARPSLRTGSLTSRKVDRSEANIAHGVTSGEFAKPAAVSKSDPWDIGTDEQDVCVRRPSLEIFDPQQHTLHEWFPLFPESTLKRIWDAFCMFLLVYCSFSVPYSIAFVTSDSPSGHLSDIDYSDLAIDVFFMIDICLTFVTQFENQGVMEKNLAVIARNYISSWFFPDLAGSFPFDIVIAAAMGSAGNLSAMKLIRMVRLVRAAKFLSKLNKLKQKEGMEAFGPAIGIFSSIFILVFSAHFLGCFFTLLAGTETGVTWLIHYDADLEYADNFTRYIVALYWAVISLTTMGYGDVVPASHIERIFAVAVALIGAVVFAHCVGTISSLITQVINFYIQTYYGCLYI